MTRPFRYLLGSPIRRVLFFLVSASILSFLYFHIPRSGGIYVTLPDDVTIDDVIKGTWNYDPGPLLYLPRSCRPRNDLVFIKGLRCAAETVGAVLRRYGYRNNLSLVLPVDSRRYLGWPYPITAADIRPSSRGYNLLVERAVYNGTFMRRLMNPGTAFVTMIREPLDQFISILSAFNVLELANVSAKQGLGPVQAYLRDIHRYESAYKSRAAAPKRLCIPDGFSVTKNLLSHGLDMPLGFPAGREDITDDFDAVENYIKSLDSEFALVMIMEYFEESLVLLRRLMCWDTKDILFHSRNLGGYRGNASWHVLTRHDRDLHRNWSRVDYLLYDHFNRTFWSKVRRQGEDFAEEVSYFLRVQSQVTWFCRSVTPYGDGYIRFPESVWSPAYTFSSEECRLMEAPLLEKLKEQYDRQESKYANFSALPAPRKFVPLC